MKKAIIYVYSGTGNTKLVAELYKEFLTDYETIIHMVRMNRLDNPPREDSETEITLRRKGAKHAYFNVPDPNEYDLVGFGYPVHGFNTPSAMYNFIKLLPAVEKGKRTFILKSSGEGLTVNNYSSQKFLPVLKRKGYDVLCAVCLQQSFLLRGKLQELTLIPMGVGLQNQCAVDIEMAHTIIMSAGQVNFFGKLSVQGERAADVYVGHVHF